MNIPHGPLASRLTELVGLFNAQTVDVPPRALHKDCVFRLNGRAYHEHLGRPPSDPLVRLIGCGPGGYRLIMNAVRPAARDARVRVHAEDVRETAPGPGGEGTLTTRATLSGQLRVYDAPFSAECSLTLTAGPTGAVREIAVTMGDADVEWLAASRRQEG